MPEQKDERNYAEVREWLVRIDANQTHQTQLLESLNARAEKALDKADIAEDKADEALAVARRVDRRVDDREQEDKVRIRWLLGLVVSIFIATLPIIAKFYGVD
ncbi:hypothetical protein [Oceanobacillus neutriphilus]|uniref:Holin n=1 Tax=Oceanobacillus neutriphilus TaxID=531815 RepID=A0ABQ2NY90_9BACI|nr:hypothetical protein [Oceanobacillus neutriphilus]GGP13590.1 hypothetical protein GCM10011346_34190 [Oceanobacillus neutriphilus]